jgi:hypothetical protein
MGKAMWATPGMKPAGNMPSPVLILASADTAKAELRFSLDM